MDRILESVRRDPFDHELAALFDVDLHRCPSCGAGDLKIVAAILEPAAIRKRLTRLGLEPQQPPRSKAREAGRDHAA
jgi:hypothetical protein